MNTIEIATERLILRPFQADDLEAFVAYRSDPDVARYQSWDHTYSMADAESFLSSQREPVFGQPGEWLQLAIVDRAGGAVYGDCAVRVATGQPATAEIGVTLAQASQRKGLATEALTAVLAELFERHGIHRVFAETDDRNLAVGRLLERLGRQTFALACLRERDSDLGGRRLIRQHPHSAAPHTTPVFRSTIASWSHSRG